MKKFFTLITVVIVAWAFNAHAQTIGGKNPRVAELEDSLSKTASQYLKGRFPNSPFTVTVNIDPLRRAGADQTEKKSEALPYYENDDEEIKDEWDDPEVSLQVLVNRAKKITVTVALPADQSDVDISDIQQNLTQVLNLTPARDTVEIVKRNWATSLDYRPYLGIAASLLLLALCGFFFITRGSVRKIVTALETRGSNGTAVAPSPSAPSPSSLEAAEKVPLRSMGGDVKFSDPIKVKEAIAQSVALIAASPAFPTLQDILILDRFALSHPASLGALMAEFPVELQRRVFSYSFGQHWLEAFSEPGELGIDSLDNLQKLLRVVRDETKKEWEKLIIGVWRLDEKRVSFVKSLKQEEAFAILEALPKSIAVAGARAAFPGNWGVILDTQQHHDIKGLKRVQELSEMAFEWLPLRDFEGLQRYRHERDLLEYLRAADPSEERDIYGASPESSVIHTVRPPFFRVLDMKSEELAPFMPLFNLDEWALAMFNVPKPNRREVEKLFSDKQKFMYMEKLKALDANHPDRQRIGLAREKIGRLVSKELATLAQAKPTPIAAEGQADDATKAA